jgi:hypothetical protein
MCLIIIGNIAMFFWVKPLRDAKAKVADLEKEVAGLNIDKLKQDIEAALEEKLSKVITAENCHLKMDKTDGEVAQIQADRRESVKTLHNKIDGLVKEVHVRVDAVVATLNKGFQDIERSIGRIEGKVG